MSTGKTVGGALLTLVCLFLVFLFFRGCETETRTLDTEAPSQLQEELEALRQEREANQRELEALRKEQELLRKEQELLRGQTFGQSECTGYRTSPPPLMPEPPQSLEDSESSEAMSDLPPLPRFPLLQKQIDSARKTMESQISHALRARETAWESASRNGIDSYSANNARKAAQEAEILAEKATEKYELLLKKAQQ